MRISSTPFLAGCGGLLLSVAACGQQSHADAIETTPQGNRPAVLFEDGGVAGSPLGGGGAPGGAAGTTPNGGTAAESSSEGGVEAGGVEAGGVEAGGATASGGNGGVAPASPEVTITAPSAATDPSDGEVLTGDSVDVRCTARQSSSADSAPIAPSSVQIELLDATGETLQTLAGVATTNTDEYAATFVLAGLPPDAVSFRCTASDTASPRRQGSATVDTFVDTGPTVQFLSPEDDAVAPLLGATSVEFEVLPAPLATADPQAEIDQITLSLAGVDIPPCSSASPPCFAPKVGTPGTYVADVDFTDALVFSPTPTLVSAIVSATNLRSPTAATRTVERQFTLDGVGPTISIRQPTVDSDSVLGGEIIVEFTLEDPAGIDTQSIVVEIDGVPYRYPNDGAWVMNNGVYRFRFDTSNIVTLSQLSIRILARDAVQNDAPGGGSTILVPIDNLAPLVDLDPGNVREVTWANEAQGTIKCTESFDPLGSGTEVSPPNDGEIRIGTFGSVFRVLAWDLSNGSPGDPSVSFAYIDPNSVTLYAKPAAAAAEQPLVYDTNGDGICDEIDPNTLAFVQLAPVPWDTRAYYPNEATFADADVEPASICDAFGTATAPPDNLCADHAPDMYHAIKHACPTSSEPVVYGIPPLTSVDCSGQTWLVTNENSVGEGWICLAASATDKAGNHGISAPLRVCFDAPDGVAADCSEAAMPSCTDGCILPPKFPAQIIDRRG